jgi:hypothetical protein
MEHRKKIWRHRLGISGLATGNFLSANEIIQGVTRVKMKERCGKGVKEESTVEPPDSIFPVLFFLNPQRL